MKKIKNILMAIVVFVICCSSVTVAYAASSNEDYIRNYVISVDTRQDGTLDITYELEWEVLKNGPVTWVKIGIPNDHVSGITALTDNIEKAEYYAEGTETFVRCDFKEKYNPGDVINFKFSIHQSYMYLLDKSGIVRYSFTPGWFDKIEIGKIQVEWYDKDGYVVKTTNSNEKTSNAYIWSYANLQNGEKITANIEYSKNKSMFGNLNEDEQYKEGAEYSFGTYILVILFIIILVVVISAAIAWLSDDGYGSGGSGFTYIGGGHGGGSSCASSCACACACAGGGRAGCSTKGFYEKTVKLKDFDKAVERLMR